MSVHIRSQKLAQAAYSRVTSRMSSRADPKRQTDAQKEYRSFAKNFPALIHTCGLAQAVAFALAKQQTDYIDDLAVLLREIGHSNITSIKMLHRQAREQPLNAYLRLSRDALNAATWLKRYVEAAGEDK